MGRGRGRGRGESADSRPAVLLLIFLASQVACAPTTEPPSSTQAQHGGVCQTRECVQRAGRVLNALDAGVDPCENFAQFACGGTFLQDNTLGVESSSMALMRENNRMSTTLEKLLENKDEKELKNWGRPEKMAHQFYWSCRKNWFNDKNGAALLEEVTTALDRANTTTLGAALRVLREQFGVQILPSRMTLRESNGGCLHSVQLGEFTSRNVGSGRDLLGLGFFDSTEELEELEMFHHSMFDVASTLCHQYDEDLQRSLIQMTQKELAEKVPEFGWSDFLNLPALSEAPVEMKDCVPDLSRRLAAVAKEYPRLVRKYLIASTVRQLWRQRDVDDTKEDCLTITKTYFGEALTAIFLRSQGSKRLASEGLAIAESIRDRLHQRLQNASWLDDDSRKLYLEKLEALRFNIGYLELIEDSDQLEEFYSTLYLNGTITKDLVLISRWRENAATKSCSLGIWDIISPLDVNAVYVALTQTVITTLGAMRAAQFDTRLPSNVNYGSIGYIIGHEIMHSLDADNRIRDRWGSKLNVSERTEERLSSGESCLRKYYSSLTENGKHVDGKNTIGENIADVYGLQLAYDAWLTRAGNLTGELTLPGVLYTPSQLFYISFAQTMCDRLRDKALQMRLRYDVHAPGYSRAIGAVAQSEQFAEVFSCPATATLATAHKRCKLW